MEKTRFLITYFEQRPTPGPTASGVHMEGLNVIIIRKRVVTKDKFFVRIFF